MNKHRFLQSKYMTESEDIQSCQLVGFAGIIIQMILGALSFSVLVYKRYTEHPKRPWKIWALDTSKQGASQMLAHCINIIISMTLATKLDNDACIWYLTTNVLDNTLGVLMCVFALKLIENYVFNNRFERLKSGNYYSELIQFEDEKESDLNTSSRQQYRQEITVPFEITQRKIRYVISYRDWFSQFLIWNFIVIIIKTMVFFLELVFNVFITAFFEFLFGWIQPFKVLELILVIIIVPVLMNGLAFWIQDNVLMKKDHNFKTVTTASECKAEKQEDSTSESSETEKKSSEIVYKEPLL